MDAIMDQNSKKFKLKYSIGLDIGIASVGWAVLAEDRIVDLGVRVFDKAETADKGESLNLQRRSARLLRRRLYRRAWRLTKLARLLKSNGLIDDANFFKTQPAFADSTDEMRKTGLPHLTENKLQTLTWGLRKAGLDRLLTANEWARVIYHLCKHRGFHWVSRAEEAQAEADKGGEGGKVKKGLFRSKAMMQEKGYRTAAEMILAEYPDAQRNKQGSYDKVLPRVLLDDELGKLFDAQRSFGNLHATEQLELAIRGNGDRRSGIFWSQKPMQSVLHMLGRCTFERSEFRAPKASFSAERHVWLTRLINLRIIVDGDSRPLTEQERQHLLPLPYLTGEKFTYKTVRHSLVKAGFLPESFRFGGLSYPSEHPLDNTKAKNPEDQSLLKLTGWHELRLTLNKAGLETVWQQMSAQALQGCPDQLDSIAWVLSVYKDDDEVRSNLAALSLPGEDRLVDALLGIRFNQFHALSLKALRKIVHLMEQGLRYDEAVAQIPEYGHHSQRFIVGGGQSLYLPPFYENHRTKANSMKIKEDMDVPRNPVVLRALNQARKVVNALIRAYGSPAEVHIEMARDLSRPLDERRDILKLQNEYRSRHEKAREQFNEDFQRKPTGIELEKWLLYREQQGKCAYSLSPLDLDRVIHEANYVQIDHALPYSRSYDDSKNNKVLVLSQENQSKGNRTAYEYLTNFAGGEQGDRWRHFKIWVETNKSYRQAKRNRLLRKNYSTEEASGFKDRNLNDTRYICRFFKNYVEQHLQLAQDSESKRCVVVNGQLTAFLRARWGLLKIRDESDRHHAMDAAVIAACSHAMVQRLAVHSRLKELEFLREGFPDPETGEVLNPAAFQRLTEHFPVPWPNFREELKARLYLDDAQAMRDTLAGFGTYPEEALKSLRPLFVSRAPQRRNGGAAHKDTIYAQPKSLKLQGGVTQKVALSSLSMKDLDNLVDPHRNEKLYAAIRARLKEHDGKADKAFSADKPLRKPDQNGNPTGPIVRSVTLVIDKMSGIPIRGGIAKNDTMLRVDLFTKNGKFHLVPIYVHHRVKGLPNRAIIQGKEECEWTEIDETFEFLYSLYPNDLIRITFKSKPTMVGYYGGCHRGTSNINLWVHDRNKQVGKNGELEGVGIKTAVSVEKLHVDTLGRVYPAPKENRRGLA